MRRLTLIFISLCFTTLMQAQVYKTVNITAGGLSTALTPTELGTVTNLTLTGTTDARDFKTMRDEMPVLAELDINGITIAAYTGPDGTISREYYNYYPSNAVPDFAFCIQDATIGKTSLTSVILPSSITSIRYWAFYGCTGLTSITIPSLVKSIGSAAFSSCTGLTSVTLPPSVELIGIDAFKSCSGLASITIPLSVYAIGSGAFMGCKGLSSIVIPSSVTSIGNNAFSGCYGLSSLTIPSSVIAIGPQAFFDCRNLISIYVLGVNPVDLSSSMKVFEYINMTTCVLHVPYGSTGLYAAANQWKDFTNIVEMQDFTLYSVNEFIEAALGSTASIVISSGVTWTASSDKTWLSVNPTTGTGTKQILTFTAGANTSVLGRTATITVSSPGVISQTIKVTQAGLLKTLEVIAGGLFSALTTDELRNVTSLKLTGTIDARDFKTMRDSMNELSVLDISSTTIAAYSGTEGTYSSHENYLANAVPVNAFMKQDIHAGKIRLTSVILPESVTSIGDWVFGGCTGLTSITIPAMVTSIAAYSFFSCTGLRSVIIPPSVASIQFGAFLYCSGLTSLTIPSSVTSIGSNAFQSCTGLTSIYVCGVTPVDLSSSPDVFGYIDKITCILHVPFGTSALYAAANQWRDFTNIVEMPGFHLSAYAVGLAAAANSTDSVAITTSNVTWAASSDKSWLTVNPTTFIGNHTLTLAAEANSSIANRTALVTVSSPGFVSKTLKVTQVGLPKTLEVTAGGLFSALTLDERSTINELIITGTIDARDFKTMRDEMPVLAELDISGATVAAYSGTEGTWSGNINYPANEVPVAAFYNANTDIGKRSLTSVILPSSATAIDGYAIAGCTGLTSVTIPSMVTSIAEFAFVNSTGLNSVTIPPSVAFIGRGAFISCFSLTSITIPSSVTSIEDAVFQGCTGLTSITIPSSVTNISTLAFSGCTGLTYFTMPSSVTSIGDQAFSYCFSLTTVTIPSSVTSIGRQAFGLCTGLTSVIIPPSVTSIEDAVFDGCTGLTSITLPSSVTYIGWDAFRDCTGLTSITIPSSVTLIGMAAFRNCTGLTSIYAYGVYPVDLRSSANVFYNVNKTTCTLHVPFGTSGLYAAADQWKDFTNIVGVPVPGSIAANQAICSGMTPAPLTSTGAGSGLGTISYRWEYSNNGISWLPTGTSVETYAPGALAQTTLFRRITISTLNGTSWESGPTEHITVTVTPANTITPTVSISASQNNVCAGTPVTFTATPVDGGATPTYKWFLNNVARATGATGSYPPKNGDVIYVEMTSSLACVTGNPATSNVITMVVNQPPSESVSINVSQNNVPQGTPVTFTAIPVGGGTSPSFLWYLNNVARATGITGTYAPKNGDEVYVVMTSGSPCASGNPATSDVVTMIVDCVPAQPAFFTQGMAYVTPGQSDIRYTVPYVSGVTYYWSYAGNGATITGTSNSVLISFSGTATSGSLSVRAYNSCGISEPRSGVITVGTNVKAGILPGSAGQVIVNAPAEKNELKVYPNPSADGPVTFDFRINEKAKLILDIFSSSGMRISRIFEGNVESDVIQTVIFNESLAPGVYIYILRWKDQIITGKLIRKR